MQFATSYLQSLPVNKQVWIRRYHDYGLLNHMQLGLEQTNLLKLIEDYKL